MIGYLVYLTFQFSQKVYIVFNNILKNVMKGPSNHLYNTFNHRIIIERFVANSALFIYCSKRKCDVKLGFHKTLFSSLYGLQDIQQNKYLISKKNLQIKEEITCK